METLKRSKGRVVDLSMNWENLWCKCLTLDNKKLVIQNGKAYFSGLSVKHNDVWVLDGITLLSRFILWVWQCHATPLLFLLTEKHMHGRSTALEPCWKKCCVPCVLLPVITFVPSSQLLAGLGNLTHWGHRGEKQLSYPSGVTAASHSWCILFSVSFTYVCFEAWSKAGKLVSKSSIKKRLHFKFLWPVSLVNKLNMSSHCDVLAESVDASQGGVNSRMSCRMGGVCIPPCPPFTAEAELFAEHYAPC